MSLMVNSEEIRNLILEFFENTNEANKIDLVYYIFSNLEEFIDEDIIEKEIEKLKSDNILNVQNENIFLSNKINFFKEPEPARLGDWNYKIIAKVILPSKKEIKKSLIKEELGKADFLKAKNNFLFYISSINLSKDERKLSIEIDSKEWESTILISNNHINIESIWKIHDPKSEWEEFVELAKNKSIIKETYMAMPASSHAISLYFVLKNIISNLHPDSIFKIEVAESIKSRGISSI